MAEMGDFDRFDQRGYATVDVRHGYGEWAATYEEPSYASDSWMKRSSRSSRSGARWWATAAAVP
jgi:hypothetical protein